MSRILICGIRCAALVLPLLGGLAPAHAQTSHNINLLGRLDEYVEYSDIWGYIDGQGREYAIVGTRNGTTFVNVTNPGAAYETNFIPGPSSIWRDMKVYGDYAYIVTEGGGGMQIVELSNPEFPVLGSVFNQFSSAHNIYIDVANARAYPCGANTGGTWILDLTSPLAPVTLGNYTTRYVHDLYVQDDVAYLAEINDASLTIADFSNPASISILGGPMTYPGAFTHNTWATEDGNYVLTTDELQGAKVFIWDVSSLPNITLVSEWSSSVANAIVHNVIVDGDRAYIAYYSEGLRVLDIEDPAFPVEVAWYDTWPGASGGFDGAWGVFPFLPSGNILVSDIQSGLYVLEVAVAETKLLGQVTETETSDPVAGALVEVVGTGLSTTTNAAGNYALYVDTGTYTIRTTREGFESREESRSIAGERVVYDVQIARLESADIQGQVNAFQGGARVALGGASLSLVGTGFGATAASDGTYAFGLVPLGSYDMLVQRPGYLDATVAVFVSTGGTYLDPLLHPVTWYDDGDTDRGWTLFLAEDTATTGLWERSVPVGSGGGQVQPGTDATPGAGGRCFVTGNAANSQESIGIADVDGGTTTLTSPDLDLSALSDPHVRYSRWYVNQAGGAPGTDVFRVEISDDGGDSWESLETLTEDAKPWTRADFRVLDFVEATAQVRLRFIAEDAAPGGIVEAAVDDVEVYDADPTATDAPAAPAQLAQLDANLPNPFNPRTSLRFRLAQAGPVRLDILDLRGRLVARLVDEARPAGSHVVEWNGTDRQGRVLASGVYLAVLDALGQRSARKMTLAK